MAEREKLNDESRRLCDIRPTGAILVITECRGEKADDTINMSIGHLIGKRMKISRVNYFPAIFIFLFQGYKSSMH